MPPKEKGTVSKGEEGNFSTLKLTFVMGDIHKGCQSSPK